MNQNLQNPNYERLWILFTKILKNEDTATFYISICRSCGFIFTNPRFSKEDMQIKYKTINDFGIVKKYLRQNPPSNLDKRANRIYDYISRYHKIRSGIRPKILDYGGANGYNLIPFVKSFSCYILDFERWELSNDIKYLGQNLEDLTNTSDFDVILVLHTLEHEIEPVHLITDLSYRLKEGGLLYVEVPLGCFKEWQFLSEPLTHINFFSEQSLFKCLELAGLSVADLSTSYQWVTHGKMLCLNILGIKKKIIENKISKYLTTEEQINRAEYYIRYLFNKEIVIRVIKLIFQRGNVSL